MKTVKKEDYVLLLTGTVNVNNEVRFVSIRDRSARLQQYIDAILFYITECKVKKIVFCENTEEPCPEIIAKMSHECGSDVEWISFKGDEKLIVEIGKSYGEAEIIDYAVKNSKLLQESAYFIKVTGRLKVRNYKTIISLLSPKRNYFITYGRKRVDIADTRFFSIKKEDYEEYFAGAYGRYDFSERKSVEKLYPLIIDENKIAIASCPVKVSFSGISGGYGIIYGTGKKEEILNSIKKFILSWGGRRVFLEDVCKLQDDLTAPPDVWARCFYELSNKRIVICGAGTAGYRFWKIASKNCKVVAWCDRAYQNIRSIDGRRIRPYSDIVPEKTDICIVCVKSMENYQSIRQMLTDEAGADMKIEWIVNYLSQERDRNYFT